MRFLYVDAIGVHVIITEAHEDGGYTSSVFYKNPSRNNRLVWVRTRKSKTEEAALGAHNILCSLYEVKDALESF